MRCPSSRRAALNGAVATAYRHPYNEDDSAWQLDLIPPGRFDGTSAPMQWKLLTEMPSKAELSAFLKEAEYSFAPKYGFQWLERRVFAEETQELLGYSLDIEYKDKSDSQPE